MADRGPRRPRARCRSTRRSSDSTRSTQARATRRSLKAGADGARARLLRVPGRHRAGSRAGAVGSRNHEVGGLPTVTAAAMAMYEAWIEQRAGDVAACGARAPRRARRARGARRPSVQRPPSRATSPQCLYEQGRYDEAYELCADVRETSPPERRRQLRLRRCDRGRRARAPRARTARTGARRPGARACRRDGLLLRVGPRRRLHARRGSHDPWRQARRDRDARPRRSTSSRRRATSRAALAHASAWLALGIEIA